MAQAGLGWLQGRKFRRPQPLTLLHRLPQDQLAALAVERAWNTALSLEGREAIKAQFTGHAQHQLPIALGQGHRQFQGQQRPGFRLQGPIHRLIQDRTGAARKGGAPEMARTINHGKTVALAQPQHPAQVVQFLGHERQLRALAHQAVGGDQ